MKQERLLTNFRFPHTLSPGDSTITQNALLLKTEPVVQTADIPDFSLPTYLRMMEERVLENRRTLAREWQSSQIWGEGTCLRDFAQPMELFGSLSGGVLVPHNTLSPALSEYYNLPGNSVNLGGRLDSRGANHYAIVNPTLSANQRVDLVVSNTIAAEQILNTTAGLNKTAADYLGGLGIFDRIKTNYISLFHALTYGERTNTNPRTATYEVAKSTLHHIMLDSIRSYYLYLLGRSNETDFLSDYKTRLEVIGPIVEYIKQLNLPAEHFRFSEIDHPLTIMGNAYMNVKLHPETDTVIGLPSGGTEIAVATQLGFELFKGTKPELLLIPLSTHSGKPNTDEKRDAQIVHTNLRGSKDSIIGKKVLVTEDNSNIGETASIISAGLQDLGAGEVSVTLAAIDPIRTAIKQSRWPKSQRPASIPGLSMADSAVTLVPITKQDIARVSDDRQLIKLLRLRRLRDFVITNSESIDLPELTPRGEANANIKICGVHNSVDLVNAINSGVRWFGIHLTHDDQTKYAKKVASFSHPLADINLATAIGFYAEKKLPIPWAELGSIKDMFIDAMKLEEDMTFVLLIRPKSANEILQMLQFILPQGFNKGIQLQIQSSYDPTLIRDIRYKLDEQGLNSIKIIQTFGLNQQNANELIAQADTDSHIDSLLLDSDLRGGTGVQSPLDTVKEVAKSIHKPWFLAGGLSPDTIEKLLLELKGSLPYGLDLESSVELEAPLSITINNGHTFARVRKSKEKMTQFVEKVKKAEKRIFYETNYRDLDIKSTEFYGTLKAAWAVAYEECGYYNLDAIARSFYRIGKENGTIGEVSEEAFALLFANFAQTYPFVPEEVMQSEDFQGEGWLANGVDDALRQMNLNISSSSSNMNALTILTAGDSDTVGRGAYLGNPEQAYRYKLSGLKDHVDTIFKEQTVAFIAHPFKMQIFEEQLVVNAKQTGAHIVFIDDNERNLLAAKEIANKYGVPIICIHVGLSQTTNDEYLSCRNLEEVAKVLQSADSKQAYSYVVDMDDVLLKEQFRREHQPKNIYFGLLENNLIQP